MTYYGKELILDLHHCNPHLFNRKQIKNFFQEVCVATDMTPEDIHFWDDFDTPEEEKQTDPKTKGTSAIQFILQSNITIHTFDILSTVHINFFSCKEFIHEKVETIAIKSFEGKIVNSILLTRI